MKQWYILISGKSEGPYSFFELKRHPSLTPDTLAWKEGFAEWIPIRRIPELRELFKDESENEDIEEKTKETKEIGESDTLAMSRDPFQFYVWLIVLLFVIIYSLFLFYRNFD